MEANVAWVLEDLKCRGVLQKHAKTITAWGKSRWLMNRNRKKKKNGFVCILLQQKQTQTPPKELMGDGVGYRNHAHA